MLVLTAPEFHIYYMLLRCIFVGGACMTSQREHSYHAYSTRILFDYCGMASEQVVSDSALEQELCSRSHT